MAINKVMVLGAGTMGMGIAQVFAEAGKTVIVRDIADAFIQRGEGVLKKNMEKKVAKGKITEEELDELEDAAALQGIARVPARVKCAVLAWHTLEEALDGEGKVEKVTTEEE